METKVRILSFSFLVFVVFSITNANAETPTNTRITSNSSCRAGCLLGGGSIVVIYDDEIECAQAVTDDGSYIVSANIYDAGGKNLAYYSGCGEPKCLFDISGLSKGTYHMIVITAKGSFDGYITK